MWFGAQWIVDSAAAVAHSLRVPELIVGLTVVAVGTSAPEFMVTFIAALEGNSDISLSNVVGSNIFNLGIILGLMVMIKPIPIQGKALLRNGVFVWCVHVLTLILIMDLVLGRVDGLILLMIFSGYILFMVFLAGRARTTVKELVGAEPEGATAREAVWTDYPKLVVGFAAVALGGKLLVDSATSLALALGVSSWVVGLTVVASGTSLPELATCLAASLKGRNDMLLGNLIGSDFFNFAGVLGLTGLLAPLKVGPSAVPGMAALVVSVFILLLLLRSGRRLSRIEGAMILLLNMGRWVVEFI